MKLDCLQMQLRTKTMLYELLYGDKTSVLSDANNLHQLKD